MKEVLKSVDVRKAYSLNMKLEKNRYEILKIKWQKLKNAETLNYRDSSDFQQV